MNPPTNPDTKHGLKSCTHYIRRMVLKNTGRLQRASMSETRVVSAATDSCSGACSSGAHVQPARQGDAIGGREHDDDRRSRRGRHAQLDRAGGRQRRGRAPAAPKHLPLVGEQHHSARRDVGRRAHRLLGHLETSVDARTACSGTSSTRSATRLVLKGRAPVRPRRVESGSGAWRRGGWERGDAGGIPSDARTSTRCTCCTRDVSCASGWGQ